LLEVMARKQERISTEMDMAHRIQMDILPVAPNIPGLDISTHMRPADEVGGDYYDVFTFPQASWIVIGDVAGHGLSSGLVMFMAQSIFSSILNTNSEISPRMLNFTANHILFQNLSRLKEQRPMTVLALKYTEGKFYFSGSHDNIYIYRSHTQQVEVRGVCHFPCGLGFMDELDESMIGQEELELADGDLLLLATDGIVEAAYRGDHARGLFEEHRIIEFLKSNAKEPLAEIKSKLIKALDEFTEGRYYDDVTFILARNRQA
jgi:serine phosphatase RsbU (regulator of sigma subunit)